MPESSRYELSLRRGRLRQVATNARQQQIDHYRWVLVAGAVLLLAALTALIRRLLRRRSFNRS
ncbi:hypothetical protein [Hydrocarboniphaga sp.]|uniref:hypothetical protein n=1 Tax=Hydrocarboniphaga sp. TaxID=2033016 RepID=UPI003D148D10